MKKLCLLTLLLARLGWSNEIVYTKSEDAFVRSVVVERKDCYEAENKKSFPCVVTEERDEVRLTDTLDETKFLALKGAQKSFKDGEAVYAASADKRIWSRNIVNNARCFAYEGINLGDGIGHLSINSIYERANERARFKKNQRVIAEDGPAEWMEWVVREKFGDQLTLFREAQGENDPVPEKDRPAKSVFPKKKITHAKQLKKDMDAFRFVQSDMGVGSFFTKIRITSTDLPCYLMEGYETPSVAKDLIPASRVEALFAKGSK